MGKNVKEKGRKREKEGEGRKREKRKIKTESTMKRMRLVTKTNLERVCGEEFVSKLDTIHSDGSDDIYGNTEIIL